MPRTRLLLPLALLLGALAAPGAAHARVPVRVGIGDQQASMFDQSAFQRAKLRRVRYFIAWDAMDDDARRLAARAYVLRARRDGFSVLLHISSDDLTIRRASLPSVAQYRAKVGRLVRYFRRLGVREFGTWNEANHASQPTYRSPTRAAQYFRAMYRMVKGRCASCVVVALDVLDQAGVERYMRTWYGALSPTYRRRATVVGIHNYGDVNRRRTTFTRAIIRQAHRFNRSTKIWFTETGGIVKFGSSFPCSTARAASRLKNVFTLARTYRRSGVQRVYIYNWTGAGCDARFDAGLTAPDGTPRPGYAVLRAQLPGFLR
ncbi:hypothetical protein FSW04_12905 [Baekduia soli]|uniref:Asl1-like glycosyl hydrolase catalytic domain-containing protein n=1 Tax=Baekduia soli TaxID=496014 RepID=A0A5B8U6B3_9ACTN|nr:glycosyl hydrolase [Baekduia soli]QEC48378.1 hypothetical protein FSW04_12905 [Baekduia soli]